MNRARIARLVGFLRELEPERWSTDFCVEDVDAEGRGTVCDATGWLPAVFPDLVEWNGCARRNPMGGVVRLGDTRGGRWRMGAEVAAWVLGMSVDDAWAVLVEEPTGFAGWDGSLLTPKLVAQRLERYVAAREVREGGESLVVGAAVCLLGAVISGVASQWDPDVTATFAVAGFVLGYLGWSRT